MSMNTIVVAFRPADQKWQEMKDIFDACQKAGIETPEEVEKFFNYEEPDPAGVEIDINNAVEEWNDNISSEGFQVDLDKVPKGVKYIRFYNAY